MTTCIHLSITEIPKIIPPLLQPVIPPFSVLLQALLQLGPQDARKLVDLPLRRGVLLRAVRMRPQRLLEARRCVLELRDWQARQLERGAVRARCHLFSGRVRGGGLPVHWALGEIFW